MTNMSLFLRKMATLRDHMRACADDIDTLLELASAEADPASASSVGPCPHPMAARQPVQSMGHANRFYCRRCGATVEE